MQQLSSISLTSELQSETVQKELRGATYDPLNQTLIAVMHTEKTNRGSLLMQVQDNITNEEQKTSAQSEEMKSKEHSTSKLRSLASVKSEIRVVESEANPIGLPSYLQPFCLTDPRTSGKQVYTTDTYHEPDCLRFCPSNSSDNLEISLSGIIPLVLQCFSRFHCPGQGLELVCTNEQSLQRRSTLLGNHMSYKLFYPPTTTPRTIGLELNLDKLTINFWINGRFSKERAKKISANHSWYPTIKFKEAEYFVIINPFAQGKSDQLDELNSNYLPNVQSFTHLYHLQTLRSSEIQLFNQYITQRLSGFLLVYNLNILIKEDIVDTENDLKKALHLDQEQYNQEVVELYYQQSEPVNLEQGQQSFHKFALLRFHKKQDSVKYYQAHKDLKILFDKQIATLVQMKNSKDKSGEIPIELGQYVYDLFLTKLFESDDGRLTFLLNSGLSQNYSIQQLTQQIKQLSEYQLDTYNYKSSHEYHESKVEYLENSDKILLVNGSQMKLVSRQNGQFLLEENSNFAPFPQKPDDKIRLKLKNEEVKYLLHHLDWTQFRPEVFDSIADFIQAITLNSDKTHVKISYMTALVVIKSMINVAINQYESLEHQLEDFQDSQILSKSKSKGPLEIKPAHNNEMDVCFKNPPLSIIDVHQLLSILLGLEDQLWALTQSDQVSSSLKNLWLNSPSGCSRLHTAYGRLSSLITFPSTAESQYDQAYLSDLGLFNQEDKYGKLTFFQDFKVELENIFEKASHNIDSQHDLRAAIEHQFPSNLMLKGFPSYNVPLSDTFNCMPPVTNENNLPLSHKNHQNVDYLKKIQGSSMILSGGNDGSMNIWNTKLRLQHLGGHNFRQKLYTEDQIDPVSLGSISSQSSQLQQINPHSEEDKKVAQEDVKIIIKKIKNVKTVPQKEQAKEDFLGEDILFTMFNEAEDAEDIGEEISSEEEQENLNILEYILDYQEISQPETSQGQKQEKVVEEEKKEEAKQKEKATQEVVEEEKQVEPAEEFLNALISMGFPIDISKEALIKIKNESLSAALDIIPEIQSAREKNKKPENFKVKIISYQCSVCTYINPEGKGICDVCGQIAPQHAYVQYKSEEDIKQEEEEAIRQVLQQEEAFKKEKEERERKESEEKAKKEQEEEKKRIKDEQRQRTKEYHEQTLVVDYVFSQVNHGKDTKPLIAGVVLKNNLDSTHEIQIQRFGYHNQYLKNFVGSQGRYACKVCDIPYKSHDLALDHLFNFHKDLIEALYPVFIGSQLVDPKWDMRTNRLAFQAFKNDFLARIIIPLAEMDSLCQIGANLTSGQSIYLIAVGRKNQDSITQVIVYRIDLENGDIKIQVLSDDSQVFKQVGIDSSITNLYYDQKADRLVVETADHYLRVYDIDRNEKSLHLLKFDTMILSQEERVLSVDNGLIFIDKDGQKVKRYLISDLLIQQAKKRQRDSSNHSSNQLSENLTENQILDMRVDPNDITIDDIKRYQRLMNGKSIKAQSNAQSVRGDSKDQSLLYTQHHWIINKDNESGPFEMEFEYPTSLISLNIDLVFNCNLQQKILSPINSEDQIQQIQNEGDQLQIDTSLNNKLVQSNSQEYKNIQNLGLLSIHGSTQEQSVQKHQEISTDTDTSSNYLPLVINHHKGASYNQQYQVCRLVTDNQLIFASNYPKPEFYFKHLHGHKMTIEKFTIRSSLNSKCGAYPVGSGLIFVSDYLSAFELTKPFHKFTLQDYNEWKEKRLKDPTPIKPYEPAAYFEFENESVTKVEIDFQRQCKYIMLKPIGLRKKPTTFTQSVNTVPMELEFFGVQGSSFEDVNGNSAQEFEQETQLNQNKIQSSYGLEFNILNEDYILKTIDQIDIQNVQAGEIILSQQLLQNSKLNPYVKLVGKTQLKITDSHLQLQDIKGLSLKIKNNSVDNAWELRGISIQGIVAEQDQDQKFSARALFNQSQIPLSYMRSCLLSPKYFNVVNKTLAQIVSSSEHQLQLRLTIIQFLNKIMKLDREFTNLILQEIDLESFLKFNLFNGESSGVHLTIEFLQNFQRNVNFCQELYRILTSQVEQLDENFIPYNGYEALIGLIIWSIPINPEQTTATLMKTLYQKICLQKISQLQTPEYINFRSKHSSNQFPFDQLSFRITKSGLSHPNIRRESIDQSHQIVPQESSNKIILPVDCIKKFKFDTHHIYDITFLEETIMTDLKIFLGQVEQTQFKLIIKILSDDGSLVFFNTFDEQIFAQFATMAYQKSANQGSNPSDDGLHLTGLDFRGKSLKVIIQFGVSNNSLPIQIKVKPPDSMIEIYGSYSDMIHSQLKIKEMIDKKAQEFWANGGKLVKVGKSMQVIQITKTIEESWIVPQVSSISTFNLSKDSSAIQPSQSQEQKSQLQISHLAASKNIELDFLQEELKGKIRANDNNVKEIVDKIQQILHHHSSQISDKNDQKLVQSLEYYMVISTDFTKIIKNIFKSKLLSQEKLESIIRSCDNERDLSNMCFQLFKRYVVFDQGHIRSDMQNFIMHCLYPLMTNEEIRSFSFKAIEEFLSQAHSTFSQRSVLESLTFLGIPEGELVSFLVTRLGVNTHIDSKAQQNYVKDLKLQPFVFTSSVLILVLNQIKQIRVPQPGQAYHKSVSCSGCNSKIIIGWRYKCGNCPHDANFDEQCVEKHLQEYPDHVMIIIKNQLPELLKNINGQKLNRQRIQEPLLPTMQFKPQQEVLVHESQSCENCGQKPIQGYLYKCVNCEEYNLCRACYNNPKLTHYNNHVFAEMRRAIIEVEKNPTSLIQLLDLRLYPSTYRPQNEESPLKKEKNQVEILDIQDDNDDDDFEDLAPLNISRSFSQPMPLKKIQKPQQIIQQSTQIYEKLDYDQQFITLFKVCVWISQDVQKIFSKEEKIVLLKLNIDTMLQLIKLAHVKHIYEVISDKNAFFQILVSILHLNSKDLINLFKNLFELIRQMTSQLKTINSEDQGQISQEKKQKDLEDQKTSKALLEIMVSHLQNFLKWMIDLGLQPDLAKLQSQQSHESWALLLKSYQNQRVWLEHLTLIVDMFIKSSDESKQFKRQELLANAKKLGNQLEKIPEDSQEYEDEDMNDLVPLSVARSISVPLKNQQIHQQAQQSQNVSLQIIKNLVQLLYINDNQTGQIYQQSPMKRDLKQQVSHFKESETQTKYLSQMWSLVLKSLTSVSINHLIEARIFDSLVNAFLISTEEIKQITFPQILSITETIAKQSTNSSEISKFICNLLFITLENVTGNHHEKVGYSICQGWLDILISSSISRQGTYESTNTVFAKMSNDEISVFLKKSSLYLNQYLNKGSFEGATGSNTEIMMRLNIATDLIYVVRFAESRDQEGSLAIQELFKSISDNQKIKKDFQDSFNYLITWLFLNARQAQDDAMFSQLGNASLLTPATSKVKQITQYIEEIFYLLGDSGEESELAVKLALQSLTSIVKQLNKNLIDLSSAQSIGYELSVKLSERSNEYFVILLNSWLVNDSIASYFVFDLNGFEFLLDTIGVGQDDQQSKNQNASLEFELIDHGDNESNQIQQINGVDVKQSSLVSSLAGETRLLSLQGSDLAEYLESSLQEFSKDSKAANTSLQTSSSSIAVFDKTSPIYLQEFTKSISMVENNGGDQVAQYQKSDWASNKKAYKHRVVVKQLTGHLRSEYWILFQLPNEIELREIQIAFNNYWGAENEVYAEPLSVLVEAGMDENNLTMVCNLQIIKDDAFGSVSATVFGQNLLTYQQTNFDFNSQNISDLITQKLSSIQNFKIKYIKFCMRRHILSCLENSPLAQKFTKQPAFGINYISLLGYDLTKIGDYVSYIKQEQKKTALEVLSIICSADFSNILKVIANQPQTIEKMKKSFTLLASLVSIKQNLIEPTFIAISTHNNEMGDWIINQILKSGSIFKQAALVGQIVICNKLELPRRLKLLQDHVMSQLRQIVQEQRSTHGTKIKKLLPFIQIFIETLRIAAPDLESHHQSQSIDIQIKESYLIDILNLLSAATQEREAQTKTLTQLLTLLLCPPKPFINSSIDIYEFAIKHLLEDVDSQIPAEGLELQMQKENLASILSVTKRLIAKEILQRGVKLDKLLQEKQGVSVEDESAQNLPLQHAIKFWINVSYDQEVKNSLASDKIPLKIYEIIRQTDPVQNQKIVRKDSFIGEQELNLMIELIKQLTAGIPKLESELATVLMQDLEHLSKIRDMNFVNKVFLQLLRIEKTVPVCLWPYDSDNKKWIPGYKPVNASEKSSQLQLSHNNNFVPSQCLKGEKRSAFIKNFKEYVGLQSKSTVKKLLTSNWTLVHSQTEQGQVSQFSGFWKSIENKAPVVILIQTTTSSGNDVTFGCFSTKGIPAMPSSLTQDSDYPVSASPEDFVFCYIDDKSFHHFSPKQGVPIISMFTDYEGGGAISVANDFMLMSYSYDFVFTTGVVYDINSILVESNPKPEKELQDNGQTSLVRFEIWSIDNTAAAKASSQPAASAGASSTVALIPPVIQTSKIAQKAGDSGDIVMQSAHTHEIKHAWFNHQNPYCNFRTNPIFMVPEHLSLTQLSTIMLQSNVNFKLRFPSTTNSNESLADLYKLIQSDEALYESSNGILDLEYEVNQLLNIGEDQKEDEVLTEGEQVQLVVSGYVPKMGLFEEFENKGGVKAIISVTLQSMRLWKTEVQAQSWELWLKELESFSEIPLFFQLFLKNSKCKDLLFKVLAGQPDQEIRAATSTDNSVQTKWDEEQKAAVQFNYKILSEAFSISDDLKLRDIGVKCGLLPTILERLGAVSGEKPRVYEEVTEEKKEEEQKQEMIQQQESSQQEKNIDRKKRKGVGYSSKVGQTFNVTQYLENKKLRNDQIKNLVDICSNFINCKEWKAGEEVLEIILESALMPLLESAFRNGSWLDMAKEYEVYHSYLALTRAIATQPNLVKCLSEIDQNYKPSQTDPIYRLLAKLNDLAEIFINCLNQQQKSDQIRKDISIKNESNTLTKEQEENKEMHIEPLLTPPNMKFYQTPIFQGLINPNLQPLKLSLNNHIQNKFQNLPPTLKNFVNEFLQPEEEEEKIDTDTLLIASYKNKLDDPPIYNIPMPEFTQQKMLQIQQPLTLANPFSLPDLNLDSEPFIPKKQWSKETAPILDVEIDKQYLESKEEIKETQSIKDIDAGIPLTLTQIIQKYQDKNKEKQSKELYDMNKQDKSNIWQDYFLKPQKNTNKVSNKFKQMSHTYLEEDQYDNLINEEDYMMMHNNANDLIPLPQFSMEQLDSKYEANLKDFIIQPPLIISQQEIDKLEKDFIIKHSSNQQEQMEEEKDKQSKSSSGFQTIYDSCQSSENQEKMVHPPTKYKMSSKIQGNKGINNKLLKIKHLTYGLHNAKAAIKSGKLKKLKKDKTKTLSKTPAFKSFLPYKDAYPNDSSSESEQQDDYDDEYDSSSDESKNENKSGTDLSSHCSQLYDLEHSGHYPHSSEDDEDQLIKAKIQLNKKIKEAKSKAKGQSLAKKFFLKQQDSDFNSSSYGEEDSMKSDSNSSDVTKNGAPQAFNHHEDMDSPSQQLENNFNSSEYDDEDDVSDVIVQSQANQEHQQIEQIQLLFFNPLRDRSHNNQQISSEDSEIPENLAKDVIKTYKIVQAAISKHLKQHKDENYVENALNLPLAQSYKTLLQDLRFDYMDMKDPTDTTGANYKHHYNTIASQNQNPPPSKMVRLAQELADLSNALPYENTNAIFVRVDQQRVDLMKALICGASNTPYAHGCYEFDIFCDNNYPREPPKMNLITTGTGSVRFNPNLYACGKVCLSLLGTWRGSATENWDVKLSTILQVLLSTQAIIMSEEVYFNEPGFENEAGTPEGEKKNEGYQNIVRYCNIKFAMIEQIKRPSKGFESAIKRHFYIKKTEILKEVHQWVSQAEKNEATYSGLVSDHNYTWANQFKATKTKYREMLEAAVKTLEEELNKLERPTDYELKIQSDMRKRQQQAIKKKKRQGIAEGREDLEAIDVEYDEDQGETQINTQLGKEINIDDEAVKDRWSRYIGAMGVEAVAKQAAANIFLSGAGALGIEIAKNLVLSGCKSFTLHDNKPISMRDLSGQFFINLEEDILNEKKKKNSRAEACMPRLKQLNQYVKCQLAASTPIPLNEEQLEQAPWNFHIMDVVILTDATYDEIIYVNEYCRKRGKKFICADAFGVFTRVFNDFGDKFEILDQNGEELQDVMIKSISNEEEGLVELLQNTKHKFQDGDEVLFSGIQGMKLKEGEKHDDEAFKSDSINETIHKVKVLTPYAFRIGNTLKYEKYEHNGIGKQLRTKKVISFKSFKETMLQKSDNLAFDGNMAVADFEKMQNGQLAHIAFEALDTFRKQENKVPGSWNLIDAEKFVNIAKEISVRYELKPEEWKQDSFELKFFYLFCFTNQGVFNPLCAFQGGYIAQECIKAITQKFTPTHQAFYYDAIEVLPSFDLTKDLKGEEGNDENYFSEKYVKEIIKTQEINHRSDGLRIIVGAELVEKLAHTRLFMVGAGAIGCELLKNYAMLGVGTGKANHAKKLQAGTIILTDPDVIEVSNLNRQFLFREKHLRNPKSSTAAAAAIQMNRELKENIIARLDKVHEGTSHIYTDQFFEDLNVVTNALDNVHARRYIDTRCVTAKTALLESGTLGPKGHVQVVLPYQTESYGSQNDPEDNNEIPHCTLKMFPEETLHCVEWARDKFGKIFTQVPQNTIKILEEGQGFQPVSQQDTMCLKGGLKFLEKKPKTFDDCIEYARMKFEKFFNHDVRQLLHVYPLDAKTKDGNLFWSLPKRPPVPIDFNPLNQVHTLFVVSFALLRANTFKLEIPSKTPRSEQFRNETALKAAGIKVPDFIPNDEKAKEIQASVSKQNKEEEKKESEEQKVEEEKMDANDIESLMKKFNDIIKDLPTKEGKIQVEGLIAPELFEKDNDANHHIDFIFAMANCRSFNYKLDPMDWITVKLKAGRIVPALSTTTSAVAGLQTLELVKLLKNCKKTDHRNIFLNLAVPIMQASEPGDVMKTKLTTNLEVTLWDRWEIKLGKDVKLKDIIDHLQKKYSELEVRDIMRGSTPLYFHAIMNAPGKEAERQKLLDSKIFEIVGADSDEKYVDIAVTCIKAGEDKDQILSGVPPVRVYFE